MSSEPSLMAMPTELLDEICKLTSSSDLRSLRSCSRRLYNIATPYPWESFRIDTRYLGNNDEFKHFVIQRAASIKYVLNGHAALNEPQIAQKIIELLKHMPAVETVTINQVSSSITAFEESFKFVLNTFRQLRTMVLIPNLGGRDRVLISGDIIVQGFLEETHTRSPLTTLKLQLNFHKSPNGSMDNATQVDRFLRWLNVYNWKFKDTKELIVVVSGKNAVFTFDSILTHYLSLPRLATASFKNQCPGGRHSDVELFSGIHRSDIDMRELAVDEPDPISQYYLMIFRASIACCRNLRVLHIRHRPSRKMEFSDLIFDPSIMDGGDDDTKLVILELEQLCNTIPSVQTIYRYFRDRPGVCYECRPFRRRRRRLQLRIMKNHDRGFLMPEDQEKPWLFDGPLGLTDFHIDGVPF